MEKCHILLLCSLAHHRMYICHWKMVPKHCISHLHIRPYGFIWNIHSFSWAMGYKPLAYWYQTQAPTLHTLQNHHAFCLKHTAFSSSVNVTTGLEEELFMTFSRRCSTFMGEVYGGVHIYIYVTHIKYTLYIYMY